MKKIQIMGVLNITPNSFFNDNKNKKTPSQDLVSQNFHKLLNADIIDIGGESSKPGAYPISYREEIDRISILKDNILEFNNKIKPSKTNPAIPNMGSFLDKVMGVINLKKLPIILIVLDVITFLLLAGNLTSSTSGASVILQRPSKFEPSSITS